MKLYKYSELNSFGKGNALKRLFSAHYKAYFEDYKNLISNMMEKMRVSECLSVKKYPDCLYIEVKDEYRQELIRIDYLVKGLINSNINTKSAEAFFHQINKYKLHLNGIYYAMINDIAKSIEDACWKEFNKTIDEDRSDESVDLSGYLFNHDGELIVYNEKSDYPNGNRLVEVFKIIQSINSVLFNNEVSIYYYDNKFSFSIDNTDSILRGVRIADIKDLVEEHTKPSREDLTKILDALNTTENEFTSVTEAMGLIFKALTD